MKHEHGGWAAHVISLKSAAPVSPTAYGWTAYWAFMAGEHQKAIDIAQRGIDQANSTWSHDTSWCRAVQVWAFIASGRASMAAEPARQLEAAVKEHPDPFAHYWALMALMEQAVSNGSDRFRALVAEYGFFSRNLGAPSIISSALMYEASRSSSPAAPRHLPHSIASPKG